MATATLTKKTRLICPRCGGLITPTEGFDKYGDYYFEASCYRCGYWIYPGNESGSGANGAKVKKVR